MTRPQRTPATTVPEEHRWTDRAACRNKPARWFTDPTSSDDTRKALDTCARCPVQRHCLAVALSHPLDADVGVWGATTEHERRRIRRTHRDAPLQDPADQRSDVPPHRNDPPAAPGDPPAHHPSPPATERLPPPQITVARDTHGDYVDATGRVIIFRIHGTPPWMVMIDRRCIARTPTLTEARRVAWTTLHPPPEPRASPPPSRELPAYPPVRR